MATENPIKIAFELKRKGFIPLDMGTKTHVLCPDEVDGRENFREVSPTVWKALWALHKKEPGKMFRYPIQKDNISKFIVVKDDLVFRPFDATEFHEGDKVMIDIKLSDDPFLFVLKVSEGIEEYWINSGFKISSDPQAAYDLAKNQKGIAARHRKLAETARQNRHKPI